VNISEGNDLNTVLRFFLQLGGPTGEVPSRNHALEAGQRLVARANKSLGAGLTSEQLQTVWPPVGFVDPDAAIVARIVKGTPEERDLWALGHAADALRARHAPFTAAHIDSIAQSIRQREARREGRRPA
jgi:hypothetical protein